MPVIRQADAPLRTGSMYPARYAAMMAGRSSLRLGQAGGLTQFGVNLVILAPGAMSSLLHAHEREDEFVMVLEGECTLETDRGEWLLLPGDCAAFPAGGGEFHHFINRTGREARFLVIGSRMAEERATYGGDADLLIIREGGVDRILHKDGRPYAPEDF